MAGTGGSGPPKNNPTVEPRIKDTNYRPKVSQVNFLVYICTLLWPTPKTQSAYERALELAPKADFERHLAYFPNRIRSRAFRGQPWPRSAENRPQNPGPDLYVNRP